MSSEKQVDVEIEVTPEIEKLLEDIGHIFDKEKVVSLKQKGRNYGHK